MLVYIWLLRRKKKLALRYASLSIVKEAMGTGMHWRRHVPPVLFLLAISAMLFAASRPFAVIILPSTQETIILAMDVSGSMRATDVKPNRLVASQEAAKAFLTELPRNVRVGIVAFAGTASVVQPPTLSREDLVTAIDKFQLQRATAIGSAIVVSLSEIFPDEGIDLTAMTYGNGRQRGISIDQVKPKNPKKEFVPVPPGSYNSAAIILLTDGQRTTGVDTLEAAKMAADRGVRIYTVGVGTVEGETIGFEGWSMRVRLDEATLKSVALQTQAEYFYAGTAENLKKVYEKLSSRLTVEKKETEISGLLALVASHPGADLGRLVAVLVQPDPVTRLAVGRHGGGPCRLGGECPSARSAVLRQTPPVQPELPRAARRQALVVGDDDKRRALVARQLQHQLEHAVGGAAVQVAGGLVGQHAGRLGDQCAGNRDTLAFAAREFRRPVLQPVLQPDAAQASSVAARALSGGRHAPDPQRHGDVVQRAELGQQVVELVDETQVPVAQIALHAGAQLRQVLAHQLHAAAGGRIERAQQVQQGALAGTRGADDGQRLAGVHLQVDALQHRHVEPAFGETLGQALRLQHDITHNAGPRPG